MTRAPRFVQSVMGTAVTFQGRPGLPSAVVGEAMRYLTWVEDTFSTFKASSEISRVSRGELDVHHAHEEVHHVLLQCARLEDATMGAFDYRHGGRLDPAGFVKGWAMDGAARILSDAGVSDFLIWAGGDVVAHCPDGTGRSWTIGVRDPHDPTVAVDSVEVTRGAVATSGAYERGEHIRRTDTGLDSVTITGPRLGIADALATAAFSAGLAKTAEWFPSFTGYRLIAVTKDRRLVRSPSQGAA